MRNKKDCPQDGTPHIVLVDDEGSEGSIQMSNSNLEPFNHKSASQQAKSMNRQNENQQQQQQQQIQKKQRPMSSKSRSPQKAAGNMAEDSGDDVLEPDQDIDKAYLDSDTYEQEADRQQSEFFNNRPKVKRQDLNNYDYEESSEQEVEEQPMIRRPTLLDKMLKKKPEKQEQKRQVISRITEDSPFVPQKEVDMMDQGNPSFKNYEEIFKNLTNANKVPTQYDLVTIAITYDSSRAITVTCADHTHYVIKQYCLNTSEILFVEHYRGTYLKMKEIEQNSDGNKYCIVYMDDGVWKLRIFGKDQREENEQVDNMVINDYYPQFKDPTLYDSCIPVAGFPDPYCTCAWLDDERIFVNFFHNVSLKHYHFIFSVELNKPITSLIEKQLDCSVKNFPYKTFFNPEDDEVYIFYRQGQAFTINLAETDDMKKNGIKPDASDLRYEQCYNADLGQMYLINNTVLAARSSSRIVFFKQMKEELTDKKSWEMFHQLPVRGFLYFIKGNVRIQIVTDEKIFFYRISDGTPELENVMVNFMKCNQMMFGRKVKYCITYKTSEQNFTIYTRKYTHNFMANLSNQNFEGSLGLNVPSMNIFFVTNTKEVKMYDGQTFQEVVENRIELELFKSDTREPNEIISMQICPYDKYLAVITGRNLIKNQQSPNQIFIFKRCQSAGSDGEGKKEQFKLSKKPVKIKGNKELQGISMNFIFKDNPQSKKADCLIFAQSHRIIRYNYRKQEVTSVLHTFTTPMRSQPSIFVANKNQKILVVASSTDTYYINLMRPEDNHRRELNIDEQFGLTSTKSVVYDEGAFYILANKCKGQLGYYLMKFDEKRPVVYSADGEDELNGEFLVNWGNKLTIGDCGLHVLNNQEEGFKELIVSFKCIYINTFNVNVIDLKENLIIFRHESFHLWESTVSGLLITANHDFITLSKEGIKIIALGQQNQRSLKDKDQKLVMLHSLESVNYLKVEKNNHILFQEQKDFRIIMIQEQITNEEGETSFDDIIQIRINDITLRELLLLQSLYVAKTQSDIIALVKEQPNPKVFYKTYLELNKSNMLNILSYDSKSIQCLLNESFKDFYDEKFPIFFTNKLKSPKSGKVYYRNAMDIGLKNNQAGAVKQIIWYIIHFQNDFISSFLFQRNFPIIMEKGIEIKELLDSQVFNLNFDYDEWPSTHPYNEKLIVPYNGSIFQVRSQYENCFGATLQTIKQQQGGFNMNKVYKIKYSANLLPTVGEHFEVDGSLVRQDVSLMGLLCESEELEVFDQKVIEDIINFKWENYARKWHYTGALMHFFYVTVFTVYIYSVYVQNAAGDNGEGQIYVILLAVGIAYPFSYDTIQLFKQGSAYFEDSWNYTDFILSVSGILNIALQYLLQEPLNVICRINMIVLIFMLLIKTFFFLRIFESLSYLVTMLRMVIIDLKIFLFFYSILSFVFSLWISILGVGNFKIVSNFSQNFAPTDPEYFGAEYDRIGLFLGNIMQTLRISMGDYEFDGANELTSEENWIYWFCWLIIVAVTNIIFLNFIIAEASNTYQKVKDQLNAMIYKERASMIQECEEMLPASWKNKDIYPEYLIIRQMDE